MATVGRRTRQSAPAFEVYEDPEDADIASVATAVASRQSSRPARSKRGLGGLKEREVVEDESTLSSKGRGSKRNNARNTKRRKVVGAQTKTGGLSAVNNSTAESKAKTAAAKATKAKASKAKAKAAAAVSAAGAASAENGHAAMQAVIGAGNARASSKMDLDNPSAVEAAPAVVENEKAEAADDKQPRLRRRTRSSSSLAATNAAAAAAAALNAKVKVTASSISSGGGSAGHGGGAAAELPAAAMDAARAKYYAAQTQADGSDAAVQAAADAVLAAAGAAPGTANGASVAANPIPAPKPQLPATAATAAAASPVFASHLAADAAAAPADTAAMVPAPGSIAMAGAAANGLETRCSVGRMVAKLTIAAANGVANGKASAAAVTEVLAQQLQSAINNVDRDFTEFLEGAGWNGAGFNSVKDENLLLDRGKAHLKYSLDYVIPELELSRGYREREAYYMRGMENEAKGGLTDNMWSILVDWMIEVQINYELSQETLFLSIDILSRYIRAKQVARTDLQLIGAVSLLIASKYEEIYPPEVNSFVYICANTYTREALLTAERNVLLALDYKLSSPLAWHFLNWVGRRVRLNNEELHLAQFFLELTLQEREFTPFPRSLVAASAINLACKIKRCDQEKVDHAIRESEYEKHEIVGCAKQLNQLLQRFDPEEEQTHNGNCRRKYSDLAHDFAGQELVAYNYYA